MRIRTSRLQAASLVILALGIFLRCLPAHGTLVMAIYNDHNLYLGSDSLSLSQDRTSSNRVVKIRAVGGGVCFTLTGIAKFGLPSEGKGDFLHFDYPDQMERAFKRINTGFKSIQARITNSVALFAREYNSFWQGAISEGVTNFPMATFTFWFYNKPSDSYYGLGWRPDGTGAGEFHLTFDTRTNASELMLQGQSDFLSALLKNHYNFPKVKLSESSMDTWNKGISREALTEAEVVPYLVELFAVHKQYAGTYGFDSNSVGEPFVIWRLTGTELKKLGEFSPSTQPIPKPFPVPVVPAPTHKAQ